MSNVVRIQDFFHRNVIDEYKSLPDEEIGRLIAEKSLPFAVLMEHWEQDFNIGTLLRNANALGAKEVFYIGEKKWDRRGAVGVQNYTRLQLLQDRTELEALSKRYAFVALEQSEGSVSLSRFAWPENPLIVVGSESLGVSEATLELCSHRVVIEQRGSVRSMNAATAASIAMYDFATKLTT
jgi:tRNA G18 (ribose-2'-O)-methylase SpoU